MAINMNLSIITLFFIFISLSLEILYYIKILGEQKFLWVLTQDLYFWVMGLY